jgi:hypothetical protein
MADLFDVSIGGAGFHLTSHIIALAALFIACFAIAGYISFRSNSIPDRAFKNKDKDHQGESVRVPFLASPAATTRTDVFEVTQPANTQLISIFDRATDTFTTSNANMTMQIGTTRTGADIMAQSTLAAGAVALGAAITFGAGGTTVTATNAGQNATNSPRKLYIQLNHAAGSILAANVGELLLMFDFYELPTATAVAL